MLPKEVTSVIAEIGQYEVIPERTLRDRLDMHHLLHILTYYCHAAFQLIFFSTGLDHLKFRFPWMGRISVTWRSICCQQYIPRKPEKVKNGGIMGM